MPKSRYFQLFCFRHIYLTIRNILLIGEDKPDFLSWGFIAESLELYYIRLIL